MSRHPPTATIDIPPEPPKPVTPEINPHITRLPELNRRRLWLRRIMNALVRLVLRLAARIEAHGLENIPTDGPLLAVTNHLGDADALVAMMVSPRPMEFFVKADLYTYPVLGRLIDAYGAIWVHRGQPDRRAIRAGLQALAEGRVVVIAPEGRESVSGALESGTPGAAFLALKAGAPVLPVTLTGTENRVIYANLRRLRRSRITFTVGRPFHLEPEPAGRPDLARITDQIMQILAIQLPPAYRGVYQREIIDTESVHDGR